MADYKLRIACSPYNCDDKRSIRVQIKCLSDKEGADTAIFAYRRSNDSLIFDHVCSTVDMVEYPVVTVDTNDVVDTSSLVNGESFKWCRRDIVDLLVRSLLTAEDFIDEVKSDVRMLYTNMRANDKIVGIEEYELDWWGSTDASDSSSSSN